MDDSHAIDQLLAGWQHARGGGSLSLWESAAFQEGFAHWHNSRPLYSNACVAASNDNGREFEIERLAKFMGDSI